MAKKRARKKPGDVVKIEIGDGHSSFARVLNYSELAFYDGKYRSQPALSVITELPVSFIIPVMNFWSKTDGWEIIGNLPLEPELLEEPTYFKQDAITEHCVFTCHIRTLRFPVLATRRRTSREPRFGIRNTSKTG